MTKLLDIYNEVRINKPISNNLKKLEQLQTQIKASDSIEEKASLSIQCAELVLPIYERECPNDNRVRKTIEAAKRGEYDRSAYEAYIDAPAGSAAESAADAASSAYASYAARAASYAAAATYSAIRATEIFFKLNEVKINNPNQIFKVTDLGNKTIEVLYQVHKSMNKLIELIPNLDYILSDEMYKEPKFQTADLFYIFSSEYGEGVIKSNDYNTVESYLSKYLEVWGNDKDSGIIYLKDFMNNGYITKIEI